MQTNKSQYLDSFQNLIEIQSIQNKMLEHQKIIKDEENRIEFLEKDRLEKAELLNSMQDEIRNIEEKISISEKTLEKLDSSIEKAKQHLKNASTEKEVTALDSEIATWVADKSDLEESLLINFEVQESLSTKISDTTSFLKGSEATLNELQAEVLKNTDKENAKIKGLKDRIENLLSICLPNVKLYFLEANLRYEFKSPIAMLEDHRCNKCQMHLPSMVSQQIESGNVLEFCPNCGRILLPKSSAKVS